MTSWLSFFSIMAKARYLSYIVTRVVILCPWPNQQFDHCSPPSLSHGRSSDDIYKDQEERTMNMTIHLHIVLHTWRDTHPFHPLAPLCLFTPSIPSTPFASRFAVPMYFPPLPPIPRLASLRCPPPSPYILLLPPHITFSRTAQLS